MDVDQLWVAGRPDGSAALENHLGGEEARNYRRFEFDTVAPHVGRSMLEVGSGLGDFASQFEGRLDRLVARRVGNRRHAAAVVGLDRKRVRLGFIGLRKSGQGGHG